MPHATSISPIPATIGIALLGGAIYLQLEDGLRAGHLTSIDCLAPVLTIAVAVCGVLTHHRLHAWKVSGVLYLAMALLGSGVIVYSSLARTATAKDGAVATAMAENRTLSLKEEELIQAKASAKVECKVQGDRCKYWLARVDQLTTSMAGLRAVATDPRADAIAKLVTLMGGNGQHARAIVSAIDPAIVPVLCELMCVLMLIAGFPTGRRLQPAIVDQSSIPMNQLELARVWGVHPSTASRRLRRLERAGQVQRHRDGKNKVALLAAPAR